MISLFAPGGLPTVWQRAITAAGVAADRRAARRLALGAEDPAQPSENPLADPLGSLDKAWDALITASEGVGESESPG